MCGIWGSFGFSPPRAVIDSVGHRGPDGEGWWEEILPNGPLVLAHRRLAILDITAAGAQPMADRSGRRRIAYNGEIYNYRELRAELEAMGRRFATGTDTEVLLAAFDAWGEAMLDRLNGMFAFVLWDGVAGRLLAARDRFGVKPLYWWSDGKGGLALASEAKQILALPQVQARLDSERAAAFLIHGQFDHDDGTLFTGLRQLRGGEMMTLRPGETPCPRRWYRPPTPGALRRLPADAVERFRALLTDAVRLRLRSDVTVGSCLSGGLDSSAIVCLAAGMLPPGALSTVSACYDGFAQDESRHMDAVIGHAHTNAIKIKPDGRDLPALLETIVHHQDGPFSSTSVFAQWMVFAAARKAGLKVMLDGQGADEHLCGYHSAFAAFHAGLLRGARFGRLAAEMTAARRRHDIGLARQIGAAAAAMARPLTHRLRGLDRPAWLRPGVAAAALPATPDLETWIETQLTATSLPMLLHYEDRNSMAHGVEARLPFLDYRLVEMSLELGAAGKIVQGQTKWLLRQSMDGVLPPQIRDRSDKIGFATPQSDWLAGPASDMVQDLLAEGVRRFPSLLDAETLQSWRYNPPTDPSALWRVVSFAAFGRVFGVSA